MDFSDYLLKLSVQDFEVLKLTKSYHPKVRNHIIRKFDLDKRSTLEAGPGMDPLFKNATFMEYLSKEQLSKVLGYKQDKICCDFVGSITNIPADDKSYSASASVHVIEHTTDPLKAIREQIRVTKISGHVLIIIPNYRASKYDFKRKPFDISYFLEQHEDERKIIKNTQREIHKYLKVNRRPPAKQQSIKSGETRPHYYSYDAVLLENLIVEACRLEGRTASLEASFYHLYSNEILALLQLDCSNAIDIKGKIDCDERQAWSRQTLIEIMGN